MDYAAETMRLFGVLKELEDDEQRIRIRNDIIIYNIRLVSHVLRKYKPWNSDQYQVGCIGLILAAQTYDMTKEVPFSSYACFCIEREIQLDYKKQQSRLEAQVDFVELDAPAPIGDDDKIFNYDLICSPEAEQELERYIEENELTFICETIIRPSIKEIADTGRHMTNAVDMDKWQHLEFLYLMDLIFIDSQKQRFGLTQMAKEVNRSIQNTRMRHLRVMDLIFQRLWDYMNLSFNDLLDRLRGNHRIPKRLLCVDPGQTTGWAFFEEGKLKNTGHLENCFNQAEGILHIDGLVQLINALGPDFILYEDYKIYANKLNQHANSSVFTLRLIGALETYAQLQHIKTHKQMASMAKTFCTDEKLQSWGLWKSGMKHARDAIRHGCYFLLFYKRGQDIV